MRKSHSPPLGTSSKHNKPRLGTHRHRIPSRPNVAPHSVASTRCLSAVEPGACFSIASYFETVTCPYVQFLTSHRCFPPCPSRPISSIATTICPGRRHLRAEPHCILLYCLSSVLWCASTKGSFRRGSAAREPAHRQSSLAARAAVWEHRTCARNSKTGSLGQNKPSRNRPKPWATEFSSSTPSPSAALTPKSASPLFFSIIFFCLSTATPPRHLPTWGFDEPCRPHLHLKLLWSLPLCPQLIAFARRWSAMTCGFSRSIGTLPHRQYRPLFGCLHP